MVIPLLAAGIGGLALSGGANLYSQYKSRQLYRRQINAYSQLENGYKRYLAGHGRKINPARGYAQFYAGRIDQSSTNLGNSYAGSLGTAGGTFGAGVMLSRKWL